MTVSYLGFTSAHVCLKLGDALLEKVDVFLFKRCFVGNRSRLAIFVMAGSLRLVILRSRHHLLHCRSLKSYFLTIKWKKIISSKVEVLSL